MNASFREKKNRHTLYHRLLVLTALFGLAFGLRLYKLDAVPLRGDEAFAVRYWAGAPADVVRDLATEEPHPFGAFFTFWAWKNTAGASEFAMRYLSLLSNLVGVASIAVLGRHFFRHDLAAYAAAALWAINPFQIWHAQDARNYALWAGISPLAMLLFIRAINTNRKQSWALYVLVEAFALYTFFLESFLIVVQVVYLLIFSRTRSVLRRAIIAWVILGLLLIPWFIQLAYLSGSGYEGNTIQSDPAKLLSWFLPTLLTGDKLTRSWNVLVLLGWLALIILTLLNKKQDRAHYRIRLWLMAWFVLPTGFLTIIATRMSIFHPRYLIALTPALLLLMIAPTKWPQVRFKRMLFIAQITLLVIPVLGMNTLVSYYQGENSKAAAWPTLAAYLEHRARPGDLILQTQADPAFNYYYHGAVDETSLDTADVAAQINRLLKDYNTVWLIGRLPEAETILRENLQEISFHTLPGLPVMQFRRWTLSSEEILIPANVTFGKIARLVGYTIQGPDTETLATTILLYWEPLAQTAIDYKVFVHLVGPPHPSTGSPLWNQDDHRPLYGFASTLEWEIGAALRDPYHLLENSPRLIPADYTFLVGIYDPITNVRLPIFAADGTVLGDSYPLMTFTWPLP